MGRTVNRSRQRVDGQYLRSFGLARLSSTKERSEKFPCRSHRRVLVSSIRALSYILLSGHARARVQITRGVTYKYSPDSILCVGVRRLNIAARTPIKPRGDFRTETLKASRARKTRFAAPGNRPFHSGSR